MSGLSSLTARDRLIFLKNKASNYGSVSGILEMEFWKWNFGNGILELMGCSSSIPKFHFQNSSVFKGRANSKIPLPKF